MSRKAGGATTRALEDEIDRRARDQHGSEWPDWPSDASIVASVRRPKRRETALMVVEHPVQAARKRAAVAMARPSFVDILAGKTTAAQVMRFLSAEVAAREAVERQRAALADAIIPGLKQDLCNGVVQAFEKQPDGTLDAIDRHWWASTRGTQAIRKGGRGPRRGAVLLADGAENHASKQQRSSGKGLRKAELRLEELFQQDMPEYKGEDNILQHLKTYCGGLSRPQLRDMTKRLAPKYPRSALTKRGRPRKEVAGI